MAPSDGDPAVHGGMAHLMEQQGTALECPENYDEVPGDRTVVIELNSVLDKWSLGSSGHHFGRCKPCAFYWKEGCKDGQACQFCHTCPPDEKKKRTKQKQAWRRAMKVARTSLRYGLF